MHVKDAHLANTAQKALQNLGIVKLDTTAPIGVHKWLLVRVVSTVTKTLDTNSSNVQPTTTVLKDQHYLLNVPRMLLALLVLNIQISAEMVITSTLDHHPMVVSTFAENVKLELILSMILLDYQLAADLAQLDTSAMVVLALTHQTILLSIKVNFVLKDSTVLRALMFLLTVNQVPTTNSLVVKALRIALSVRLELLKLFGLRRVATLAVNSPPVMKVLNNVLVSVQTECTHLLTTHADAELALTLRTQTILVKESQVIQQTVSLLFSTVVMVPTKLEVLLVTANNLMIVVMNVMEDQAQETKSLVFVLALLPYQLTNFVIKNVELTPLFKASPHHLK